MKTNPMPQQSEALRLAQGRDGFALFMDMGTGKTWALLAEAEAEFIKGNIDGMLVLAPKGVHTNWIRREIPAHLAVPYYAVAHRSGAGKRETALIRKVLNADDVEDGLKLRILSVNIEAIIHKAPFELIVSFIKSCTGIMIAIDESDTIKNPRTARTKAVMSIRQAAINISQLRGTKFLRRIATGTPALQSPIDVFAQMEFLEAGLLKTDSYRAFVAEYTELLPDTNPLVRSIMAQQVQRNPWAARRARAGTLDVVQLPARDEITGAPRYRNLDKLAALLAPHSYRVRKEECLQLPPKVYMTEYFELGAQQRALYDQVEHAARIELERGEVTAFRGGNMLGKLQQVTSGYVLVDGAPRSLPIANNPRVEALEAVLAKARPPFIIFAWYVEEIAIIMQVLRDLGLPAAEYRGGIRDKAREAAVDQFQAGELAAFVAQQASGGIGLTLTRAETVIYFSNSFSSRVRLQSEDRAHRTGLSHSVLYVDLCAIDTVDEAIATAHQRKVNLARQLLDHRGLPIPLPDGETHIPE